MHATLIAQVTATVLAFGIFFLILKKFAWGPILGILDERKSDIENQYAEIERLKERALKLEQEYQGKLREIDDEARRRTNEAVVEGQRIRDEILAKAQEDAKVAMDKQKQAIELEIAKARIELKDEVVEMVISTTERLLKEQLDHDKQRELVGRFIDEVRENGGEN